ncbi:MAG: hypothetical protein RL693_583 [Verrucomicrobiota bacterium]|jgi:hypothetical protein
MNRQRYLLPALLTLTVARFLMLLLRNLSPLDQALLRQVAEPLAWSPPYGIITPLLVKASTSIFGNGVLGVSFFAPLLILLSCWLLWGLVKGMFDATTASWALVFYNFLPAVNLAATNLTATTTGLLASIAVLSTLRFALHHEYRLYLQWWLHGAMLLLAFFIDWRLAMLGVAGTTALLFTGKGRRTLGKWPVLTIHVLCLGVACGLFMAWGRSHDWEVFATASKSAPIVLPFIGELILHAGSPLMLLALAWGLLRSVLHKPVSYTVALHFAYSLPLLLLDGLTWKSLPWPASGFAAWIPPATILLAHQFISLENSRPKLKAWIRFLVLGTGAAHSLWLLHG